MRTKLWLVFPLCMTFLCLTLPVAAESIVTESILAFSCADVTEIPQAECEALVALYNNTNGPSWTNQSGWLASNTPCSWYGTTCDAGHVTEIRLSRNQLSGPLPAELLNLGHLRVLIMQFNKLVGNLPPGLSTLAELRELDFFNNQFSGSIPSQFGGFASLQKLSLSDNKLTGVIPPELGNLGTLTHMWLSNNRLSGSIPPELGRLTSLRLLSISQTYQLTGPIPPELGNLSNLENLYLYNNALTGSIPTDLGRLTKLRILYLFSNGGLSGTIPPQIWQLPNLEEIWLEYTRLTGAIPAEVGNLSKLRYLRVGNTSLSGTLPHTLTALSLQSFWFRNTGLCEPGDPAFQSWLAGVSDLQRTGVVCTSLILDYSAGAPGSYFAVTGYGFPSNATATISVNGRVLGTTAVDADGELSIQLATESADTGRYVATASANPSASASFLVAAGQPLRPKPGPGPALAIPPGIAFTKSVYLPVVLR